MAIRYKEDWEIEIMKEAGNIVKKVFTYLAAELREGLSTYDIDMKIARIIRDHGASPTFMNYRGFPGNSCISLNEQVVHGIPSKKVYVKAGDLLKIDVGATYNGYIADAARTYAIGAVSGEASKLLDVCRRALDIGIENFVNGRKLGDIGAKIEDYVLSNRFSVVRQYVGHGVGKALHEDPQIPNFRLNPGSYFYDYKLRPGLCVAIEPMVNAGGFETYVLDDGWTVVTKDGSLSAHFEDTMAITEKGTLVLTRD